MALSGCVPELAELAARYKAVAEFVQARDSSTIKLRM